jgi:hypothetical protein
MWEIRNAYKILVGKPERNKSLRRHRRRSEDNIYIDLSKIGWECVDWIDLVLKRDR